MPGPSIDPTGKTYSRRPACSFLISFSYDPINFFDGVCLHQKLQLAKITFAIRALDSSIMAASTISVLLGIVLILCTFALEPTLAQDFCVADLKSELTPSGYPCQAASSLSSDSFVFTGLRTAGNVSNNIGAAVTPAFSAQFPAVNGLGVSIARIDLAVGGVVPLHIHSGASEILLVVYGVISAGFISSANVVYSKTLYEGDIMVFPQGLLHYQINAGKSGAIAFASFSDPIPGLQIVALSLFSSNLPSAVIEKTTFLSDSEVKRLKAFLGGSG